MYGFIGVVGKAMIREVSTEFPGRDLNGVVFDYGVITHDDVTVKRKTISRFMKDKVWFEDDRYIIASEGVILNLADLMLRYESTCADDLIIRMIDRNGYDFIKELNGNFSIAVIDKRSKDICLLTSHFAFRPLYYAILNGQVLFSTDISWMYNNLGNAEEPELDMDGAYLALTAGFMYDNKTLVKKVKKVVSGEYVIISGQQERRVTYWDINAIKENTRDYEETIDIAEDLFSKAVKRCFEKDIEYGFNHICTLSGGLDSRSVVMVADDLGYKKKMLVTFCEHGQTDGEVASEIAVHLNNEHILYDLDNGICFFDIEKIVRINGGLICWRGASPTERICELINFSSFGLLHGGDIGDAMFGGSFEEYNNEDWDLTQKTYSSRLIDRLSDEFKTDIKNRYKTGKIFCIYNRGVNANENGYLASNLVTETTSAFMDKEFAEFILSVPSKYLINSRLYIDWMKKYHPEMCLFIWAKNMTKPGAKKTVELKNRVIRRFRKVVLKKSVSMNPFEAWYADGKHMKLQFDEAFESMIDLITDSRLKTDCTSLYREGSIYEKMQVLSLLAAIKVFRIHA